MKVRYAPIARGYGQSQRGLAYAIAQSGNPYIDVPGPGLASDTDTLLRTNELEPIFYVGSTAERMAMIGQQVIPEQNSSREPYMRRFLDTQVGRIFVNPGDGTWN